LEEFFTQAVTVGTGVTGLTDLFVVFNTGRKGKEG